MLLFTTGKAKSFDHCALVHAMWKRLAELRTGVWVERVPTELNIADDPSRSHIEDISVLLHLVFCFCREDYRLLGMMRRPALRREAHLDNIYWWPQTWESLSLREVNPRKRKR